jgi:hypothetical protein
LPAEQVRAPTDATEVTLSWDDLDTLAVAEDSGRGSGRPPLVPWQEGTAVPAPPVPFGAGTLIIDVVGFGGQKPRRPVANARSRTRPARQGTVPVDGRRPSAGGRAATDENGESTTSASAAQASAMATSAVAIHDDHLDVFDDGDADVRVARGGGGLADVQLAVGP